MKTRTVTVTEGEWFDEPSTLDGMLAAHRGAPLSESQVAMLRQITGGGEWGVELRHGSTIHRVLRIGIYDGWPSWQPRICVMCDGTLGPETQNADWIDRVHPIVACDCEPLNHRFACSGFRVLQ